MAPSPPIQSLPEKSQAAKAASGIYLDRLPLESGGKKLPTFSVLMSCDHALAHVQIQWKEGQGFPLFIAYIQFEDEVHCFIPINPIYAPVPQTAGLR